MPCVLGVVVGGALEAFTARCVITVLICEKDRDISYAGKNVSFKVHGSNGFKSFSNSDRALAELCAGFKCWN